jgi:hypothetical protein
MQLFNNIFYKNFQVCHSEGAIATEEAHQATTPTELIEKNVLNQDFYKIKKINKK